MQFDLMSAYVNPVLSRMRDLGLERDSSVILQEVDAALADRVGWSEALGSLEQLLLNVGLLIVVGALALRGQRLIWRRWKPPSHRRGFS